MDIELLKEITYAFNSTNDFNAFRISLDLLNITLDTAQIVWSNANELLIDKLILNLCKDGKIDFEKAFNQAHSKCDRHMVLPYLTTIKNDGVDKKIVMKIITKKKEDFIASSSVQLIDDIIKYDLKHDITWRNSLIQLCAKCAWAYHH